MDYLVIVLKVPLCGESIRHFEVQLQNQPTIWWRGSKGHRNTKVVFSDPSSPLLIFSLPLSTNHRFLHISAASGFISLHTSVYRDQWEGKSKPLRGKGGNSRDTAHTKGSMQSLSHAGIHHRHCEKTHQSHCCSTDMSPKTQTPGFHGPHPVKYQLLQINHQPELYFL